MANRRPIEGFETPRFNVGDPIEISAPGSDRGKRGVVREVIQPTAGDFVYRYRAQFADSSLATFFGFELKIATPRDPAA